MGLHALLQPPFDACPIRSRTLGLLRPIILVTRFERANLAFCV